MKNKINIDRLFQEKFKDFETEPNKQTWLNIQTAMYEDKNERKIIPIWFRCAGIVAALLLCFLTISNMLDLTNSAENSVILESEIVVKNSMVNDSLKTKVVKEMPRTTAKEIIVSRAERSIKVKKDLPQLRSNPQDFISNKSHYQNAVIVYGEERYKTVLGSQEKVKEVSGVLVSTEKNNLNNAEKLKAEPTINNVFLKKPSKDKAEILVAKISVIESETATSLADNELELFLKEKESKKEQIVVNMPKSKWEVVPSVAAIYIKNNAAGSTIDPKLSNNRKTENNGFSYGIGINYALNNKVTLRSGISTLSIGNNTKDVLYSAGLNRNSLANVNSTANEYIEIKNQALFNSLATFEKDLQNTSMGSINQKMGYYEVPLEISYSLVNKNIEIKAIGGLSTLFLNQNEVALIAPEAKFKLGGANNLSSVHISTNLGFGFRYQIIKSFQFNFEPMVKYQLNAYSKESIGLRPILIGLYTGISYKF